MKKNLLVFIMFFCTFAFPAYIYAAGSSAGTEFSGVKSAKVSKKKIIVTEKNGNKAEYVIKGVCYAPDVNGDLYCADYHKDLPLIKEIGANSLRTYRPLGCYYSDGSFDIQNSLDILNTCLNEGLTITVGFSYEDMADGGLMEQYLKEFGDHPAIIAVGLGNEYNYHYDEWFSKEEWLERLAAGVKIAKKYAPNKIIATVHGEMPSKAEYKEYTNAGVHLIMLNMYRGENFGFASSDWYKMTKTMPWVLSEFGRGSLDGEGNDTSHLQKNYIENLVKSMEQGYLFTLVDDPGKGAYEISPNIGREDSMGIYDADRNPKPAVQAVKQEYNTIEGMVPLN